MAQGYHPLIVVPVFGDTSSLFPLLSQLDETGADILVINDGNGPDLTDLLISRKRRVYDCVENRGVGYATRVGLSIAKDEGYSGIVAVDADGAHTCTDVCRVLSAASGTPHQAVLTQRFGHIAERYIPMAKRDANLFAARLFEMATGYRLNDVACGLRYYPTSMADSPWREDRFGFIYETLKTVMSLGLLGSVEDVFVEYPPWGPYVTKANELADLVRFCCAEPRTPPHVRDVLLGMLPAVGQDQWSSSQVLLGDVKFELHSMPDSCSYLIVAQRPRWAVGYSAVIPSTDGLAVGIIADGGRRWSREHSVSTEESYSQSATRLRCFLENHCHELDCLASYWLSIYNFERCKADLDAVFHVIGCLARIFEDHRWTSVYYGDLGKLPGELRDSLVRSNLAASGRSFRAPMVLFCIAYSSAWEAELMSPVGKPWSIGLSPLILQKISDLKLHAVLRTGNARTLSDFLPIASSYAVTTFDARLFNDVDLDQWLREQLSVLRGAVYGGDPES